MTSYCRGEVLLLPFPFTDLSSTKRRPAVVLSTDAYNARHLDVIVAPVTSNASGRQPHDCAISEWSAAGLAKPSLVKGIIGTVEQSRIIRRLGSLTAADMRAVERAIAPAIGLVAP